MLCSCIVPLLPLYGESHTGCAVAPAVLELKIPLVGPQYSQRSPIGVKIALLGAQINHVNRQPHFKWQQSEIRMLRLSIMGYKIGTFACLGTRPSSLHIGHSSPHRIPVDRFKLEIFIHDHVAERIFNWKTQAVASTCRRTSAAAAHVTSKQVTIW